MKTFEDLNQPYTTFFSQYRQTVIHNLPQLEKLDNVAISSQERVGEGLHKKLFSNNLVFKAEALRFGEGVGEVDQDDTDSLVDINRRMSIEVGRDSNGISELTLIQQIM